MVMMMSQFLSIFVFLLLSAPSICFEFAARAVGVPVGHRGVASGRSISNNFPVVAARPPGGPVLDTDIIQVDRRQVLFSAVFTGVATVVALPDVSLAATTPPSPEELAKLTQGYERLQYLLANWDAITVGACRASTDATEQVVATNGVGCDKAPLKVQEYVGYKSINDPLFKAEKLMMRAVPLLSPDGDVSVDEYVDLVNLWAEKAQMSSLNAYTSSWGEANPNGGQTKVAAFLDDARFDVEDSADVLRKILKALDLPTKSA